MILKIDGITQISNGEKILDEISFSQEKLQKIAIVGETGSGKSTLLKIISGSGEPDAGDIIFEGKRVPDMREKLLPGHKGIAYLTQYFELQKFLTVKQILGYANTLSSVEAELLYQVCDISHLLHRRTDQLSGGEKQRTALARLLTTQPRLLLLDEPFSNLDISHKTTLKKVIKEIGEKLGITCLLVSHEPQDTLGWANEIIVLKKGRIVQQDKPFNIFYKPKNDYVAGLFGKFMLVQTQWLNKTFNTNYIEENKQLFLRPAQIKIAENEPDYCEAQIIDIEFTGNFFEISAEINGFVLYVFTTNQQYKKDETIRLALNNKNALHFI